MPSENRDALISQLQQMRKLLDATLELLEGSGKSSQKHNTRVRKVTQVDGQQLDFEMPERAFFNAYARNLGGPQKFALVVAYLSKGKETHEVSMASIETYWARMTGLLGAFNYAHSTRAKDRDWVNSAKKGTYHLRPKWREAIQ